MPDLSIVQPKISGGLRIDNVLHMTCRSIWMHLIIPYQFLNFVKFGS